MAKSSLQALFADREKLQLETLAAGAEAFATRTAAALTASRVPKSRPLLRLCEAWFDAVEREECRGCLLTAAVAEYRGREGAIPSAIRAGQARWTDALQRAATAAVDAIEIDSEADVEQIVFEVLAFQAAANVAAAMGDFQGVARARAAVRARIGRDEPGRSRL